MLLYVGAGLSTYFEIPDMRGFINLFDTDNEIGGAELYSDIRSYMDGSPNLEVLMTILSDLSKSPDDFWQTVAPHTSQFLIKSDGLIQKYAEKKSTTSSSECLPHWRKYHRRGKSSTAARKKVMLSIDGPVRQISMV